MNVFPTTIRELLCHTGTRCFVRSCAVCDDCTIVRNLVEMLFHFAGRYANRGGKFLVGFSPRLRISRINKRELFAPVQPFCDFIYYDSCCLHNVKVMTRLENTDIKNKTNFFGRLSPNYGN